MKLPGYSDSLVFVCACPTEVANVLPRTLTEACLLNNDSEDDDAMAKPLEENDTTADLETKQDLQIDLSSTSDPIAFQQEGIKPNQIEKIQADATYPSGWRFLFMTIGIMTSVLVVALDNYIICMLL